MEIILTISIVINILLGYAVYNSIKKIEKYEDLVQNQVGYMQNISDLIIDSQKHLQNLDEKGVFQSDDEVGYFFNQMMAVQKELNMYMLPKNYGKKES